MQGSIDRVKAVVSGEMPDRAPLFDLLRNDAVIAHFTGRELTVENAPEVVPAAYPPAVDATRSMRFPEREEHVTLEDGRKRIISRWTSWTAHREFKDAAHYETVKRAVLEKTDPTDWSAGMQQRLEDGLSKMRAEAAARGDFFFFNGYGSPGLTSIYSEIGLESFSYFLADCPDIIIEQMEHATARTVTWFEHYPENHGQVAYFMADDIAFKSGPLLSPVWMREHYFPRLARITDVMHKKGIKLLFHSDGNLNPILDDLVEAGIDGLNPIEVLAGMDVGEIHRRYPHLFMAGGIDVSQLLPFGSPAAVKDAVKRALDDAEGRIMIGSTTELHDAVPLENFLAMREAVLENPY
jgi:uroporphyrinogen decarboxylase